MQPKIIYEDEYLLALDKPSGLLVHGDGRSKERTLTDWINENYPELKDVGEEQILQNGEKILRPGIVHRLDRETSGIIIVAKTKEAFEFLKGQFKNRKIQKIYHAIVWGDFSDNKKEGVIDKSIGRSTSDFRRWSAEYGAKGELREAVTEYKVLAPRPHSSLRADPLLDKERVERELDFSYLEVKPKTGRTHQIRVHMKALGHPVVCDKLYSNKVCDPEKCLGFSRLALHALSISMELPDRSHIKIESSLPLEFQNAWNLLKKA